jgi:hypothetical protein
MCHASKVDVLNECVAMARSLKTQIQKGEVKLLITTYFKAMSLKDRSNSERTVAQAFTEILQEPVTDKGLSFKIDRLVRSIAAVKDRQNKGSNKNGANDVKAIKGGKDSLKKDADKTGSKITSQPSSLMVEPLKFDVDFWLANKEVPRRIAGRWMMKLTGPGPEVMHWDLFDPTGEAGKDAKGNKKSSQAAGPASKVKYWKCIPTDPQAELFNKVPGNWIFRGERAPEFHDERWWFVDENPHLGFFAPDGKLLAQKLGIDESNVFRVASDSEFARSVVPLIQATFVKVVRKLKDGSVEGEEDSQEIEKITEKDPAAKKDEEEKAALRNGVKLVDPLSIKSDCWLIKHSGRKVADRWISILWGPTPDFGRWEETDKKWQWMPTSPLADPYIKEQGAWCFDGVQPRFEEGAWIFAGPKPKLRFVHKGQSYGAKLELDAEGLLNVAKDSARAEEAIGPVRDAQNKIYMFDKGDGVNMICAAKSEDGEEPLEASSDEAVQQMLLKQRRNAEKIALEREAPDSESVLDDVSDEEDEPKRKHKALRVGAAADDDSDDEDDEDEEADDPFKKSLNGIPLKKDKARRNQGEPETLLSPAEALRQKRKKLAGLKGFQPSKAKDDAMVNGVLLRVDKTQQKKEELEAQRRAAIEENAAAAAAAAARTGKKSGKSADLSMPDLYSKEGKKSKSDKHEVELPLGKEGKKGKDSQDGKKPGAELPLGKDGKKPGAELPLGKDGKKPGAELPLGKDGKKPGAELPLGKDGKKPGAELPLGKDGKKPGAELPLGKEGKDGKKPGGDLPFGKKDKDGKDANKADAKLPGSKLHKNEKEDGSGKKPGKQLSGFGSQSKTGKKEGGTAKQKKTVKMTKLKSGNICVADSVFGPEGGRWDFVTDSAKKNKAYVYVPIALINSVSDPRALELYWYLALMVIAFSRMGMDSSTFPPKSSFFPSSTVFM